MIKIAHLYYDLLNLYGENGNILAIKDQLEKNNIPYEIDFVTKDDKINFLQYDLIYVGSGTENNILIALNDIMKYQDDLKDYINQNKYLIATGNANILFGKSYKLLTKEVIPALNLFDYESIETPFRTVGEQFYYDSLIEKKVIGFLNHQVLFKNYPANMFKVLSGNGYAPRKKIEGLNIKNFYGTLLIGPLLTRNFYFLDNLLFKFCKDNKVNYNTILNEASIKAYENYLNNFSNN